MDFSVICGVGTPPRPCDPPCSEKQAGIGPISQKPELLTTGLSYDAALDCASFRKRRLVSGRAFGYRSIVGRDQAFPGSRFFTF
jgi:hypothetical protein